MSRIIIQTLLTHYEAKFKDKDAFKEWFVNHLVPEDTDPLRRYNFTVMEEYGHENFFLTFIPPNKGILTHIYPNRKLYESSVKLRKLQQKLFNENNIGYEVSNVFFQV